MTTESGPGTTPAPVARRFPRLLALLVALAMLSAGCSGDHSGHGSHGSSAGEAPSADHDGRDDASSGRANTRPDTPWIADDDHDALFTVDCRFSHRASDDPIVHPGHPGMSHSHEFFGSTATDAFSTGDGLRGTDTTCEDRADTAAYWTPTLSIDGVPVDPLYVRAYYRARPGVDVRDVVAPPLGLAMIAGDPALGGDDHGSHADHSTAAPPDTTAPATDPHADEGHQAEGHSDHDTAEPKVGGGEDPTDAAGWGCGLTPKQFVVAPPTDCTDASPLTLRLRFPDCWNGRDLDSPDHRAHVARSTDGACPSTHPVLMTELQLSVVWPVTGEEAARASISSGGFPGAHGDFLNGWEPAAIDRHVRLCIHAEANCTIG